MNKCLAPRIFNICELALVEKIEITKRSKVRRKNLSYLRERSGKSARLSNQDFDRIAVNDVAIEEEPAEAPAEETSEAKAAPAEAPKEDTPAEAPKAEEPKVE